MRRPIIAVALGVASLIPLVRAAEPTPAERGEQALLTRTFIPPTVGVQAYETVWKQWGDLTEPPARYAEAVMDRYGLHPAPYPNGGYPMGLRETKTRAGKGLAFDCMVCHAGSINGQSLVGLGNASLDFEALNEELWAADGLPVPTPFTFCNVRGTSEAGMMSVFLLSFREADLSLRLLPRDLGLRDDICEDVPAWWLMKKKQTFSHCGNADTRTVRGLMQFMLHPLNSAEAIKKEEATFADIREYLLSLPAPKYPFATDADLARRGEALYSQHCARCHGTHGDRPTYPNKIIPLETIGTDPNRLQGFADRAGLFYNQSWFAQEKPTGYPVRKTDGYQAPPLDGVWATAPYFHNGSAPTVYHVLNSKARPKIFTRSYRTDKDAYDAEKVGWKITVLDKGPDPKEPAIERRKVYDTTQPGRGNGGHTFGDALSEPERAAVIEYLKTL